MLTGRKEGQGPTHHIAPDIRAGLLRRFGNFALAYSVSFQPDMAHFGDTDGFLAYRRVGRTALVLADPVAPARLQRDLLARFMAAEADICLWQVSRPVAEILAGLGFTVNEMGVETSLDLTSYHFNGPDRRNFRSASHRVKAQGITIAERPAAAWDPAALRAVSEQWRATRTVKRREMSFLVRPVVLDDEADVRKFFAADQAGNPLAFAVFDPIFADGEVVGYLCSARRRLPEADPLIGYALLRVAIEAFRGEGKTVLSLGLSPFAGIDHTRFAHSWWVKRGFSLIYRNKLFNRFIYPLQGLSAHKAGFGGTAAPSFYAFNRSPSLPRLAKLLWACRLVAPGRRD